MLFFRREGTILQAAHHDLGRRLYTPGQLGVLKAKSRQANEKYVLCVFS